MSVSENPRTTFIHVFWEVATNIVYLAGIAIIELVLRPMFGSHGVPILADWILTISEFGLLITLTRRLYMAADGFVSEIADSRTFTAIVQQIKSRPRKVHVTQFPQAVTTPVQSQETTPHARADENVAQGEEGGSKDEK